MPRFHLSTLLIVCVFVGASVGAALNHKVWQLEYTLPLDNEDKGETTNPRALAVDDSGKQIAAVDDFYLLLFDVQTKTRRWIKPKVVHQQRDRVRFLDNGKILQVQIEEQGFEEKIDSMSGSSFLPREELTDWYPDKKQQFSDYYEVTAWSPDRSECVVVSVGQRFSSLEVINVETMPLGQVEFEEIEYPYCAGYFKDGKHLVIGGFNYLGVWRRTRNYGWLGLFELPLTWIVLISFGAMNVIFVRWVRARRRVSLQAG